ncbi:MAG: methyltransferase [Propionibacteriales bacterium]|nr:methyltransferase [Propionibacteriales bacterium]
MSEMIGFGSLDIGFDDSVLRPRPWTIAQSLWAGELLVDAPDGAVLELCAGVGHIGLALASSVTRDFVLVDVDVNASSHAQANALAAGIADRVDVRNGLMDEVLTADERFAFILADPPWVRSEELTQFPLDPLLAIDGGQDGLDLARICVEVIGHHLAARGAAILQLGDTNQASSMSDYLASQPQIGLRIEEVRTYGGDGVLVRLARGESVSNP